MSYRKIAPIAAGTFLWLIALGAGFAGLQHYAGTPGPAQTPASNLAEFIAQHRHPQRGLAIMAVHPRCPCTTASLAELGDLLARSRGSCDALLLEYQPLQPPASWPKSAPTRQLGGTVATVIRDTDGKLARMLGAQTSGHLVFADASGAIRFHGGITLARGHQGRSPGQDAILTTLAGGQPTVAHAPVYGCALVPERSPASR